MDDRPEPTLYRASHLMLAIMLKSLWTHKEQTGPQPSDKPGWSLNIETTIQKSRHGNRWASQLGAPMWWEEAVLGKVWSRRTCVRLGQERQRMIMKGHLYLSAPITLTPLDNCHLHSQVSRHSEGASHLFVFTAQLNTWSSDPSRPPFSLFHTWTLLWT